MRVEVYVISTAEPRKWRLKAKIYRPGAPMEERSKRVHGLVARATADRAAKAWQKELAAEGAGGAPRTVGDAIDYYLAEIAPVALQLAGEAAARSVLNLHVRPHVGQVALARLGAEHVDRILAEAHKRGLGYRSKVKIRAVFGRLCSILIRRKWLVENPVRLTDPPRDDEAKVNRRIPMDAVARILAAARGSWLELPVSIALTCGLRRGEICGLQVADLDLEAGLVHVRRKIADVGGRIAIGAPKARSARAVSFPPELAPAFAAHLVKLDQTLRVLRGTGLEGSDWLFMGSRGAGLRPQILTHAVAPLCRAAGLPPGIQLHALRHTHASEMLARGADLIEVSRRLGHSRASTTTDNYLGESLEAQARLGRVAAGLFARAQAPAASLSPMVQRLLAEAQGAKGVNSGCQGETDTPNGP